MCVPVFVVPANFWKNIFCIGLEICSKYESGLSTCQTRNQSRRVGLGNEIFKLSGLMVGSAKSRTIPQKIFAWQDIVMVGFAMRRQH